MASEGYRVKHAFVFASVVMLSILLSVVSPSRADLDDVSRALTLSMDDTLIEVDSDTNIVSNNTRLTFHANFTNESDATGLVYAWTVTCDCVPHYDYGEWLNYTFRDQGLYEVELVIFESMDELASDHMAIMCLVDADMDALPDWWETYYLEGTSYDGEADPDDDGFDNLEEYLTGTNPSVYDEPTSSGSMDRLLTYLLGAGIIALTVFAVIYPQRVKKRMEIERKKMEYAIEIEKSLHEEEK